MGRHERLDRDFQNRKARQLQSGQDLQRMAQQAAMVGMPPPLDRFGNPVEVGDKVLFNPPMWPVFDVADIQPMVGPNVPPGQIQVILTTVIPLGMRSGQMSANIVIVGSAPPQVKPAEDGTQEPAGGTTGDGGQPVPDPAESSLAVQPAAPGGIVLTDVDRPPDPVERSE